MRSNDGCQPCCVNYVVITTTSHLSCGRGRSSASECNCTFILMLKRYVSHFVTLSPTIRHTHTNSSFKASETREPVTTTYLRTPHLQASVANERLVRSCRNMSSAVCSFKKCLVHSHYCRRVSVVTNISCVTIPLR